MQDDGWDIQRILIDTAKSCGLRLPVLSRMRITGADPVVPSRHRIGAAAAISAGLQAAGIARMWELRSGQDQEVRLDVRRAVVPGLRTISHIRRNGHAVAEIPGSRIAPIGMNRTRDGRWFWLAGVSMYPDQLITSLDVLKSASDPESVARAVAGRDAEELEEAFAHAGLPGAFSRSREEWARHPQGRLLQRLGPVRIEKVRDGEPVRLPMGGRPLSGVRVLDLSHVLAGPVTGRTLAEQGAEVLQILSPNRIEPLSVTLDTAWGKRSAHLDLGRAADAEQARKLAAEADVIICSYRTGAMDRHGLGPNDFLNVPGKVYVSVTAYGGKGPWRHRRGYDPVGQLVCGLAISEGSMGRPKLAATVTLNDYLTAYFGAAGAVTGLIRRWEEGGSYHVHVSLTQSSMWLLDLGMAPVADIDPSSLPDLSDDDLTPPIASAFGELIVPKPLAHYTRTPAYWGSPPAPTGSSLPLWSTAIQGISS